MGSRMTGWGISVSEEGMRRRGRTDGLSEVKAGYYGYNEEGAGDRDGGK